MGKLPRVHQKIFAENALDNEIGQFGSAIAGEKKETGDIAEIQALDAWRQGWSEANVSKNRYPAMQERNGIDKVITQQLAYIFQEGMPEWDKDTVYSDTSWVKVDNKVYKSKVPENKGHLVMDTNYWEEFIPELAIKAIQDQNGDIIDKTYVKNGDYNDLINQSKALYTGQVSNNPLVYADIEKSYRSTFDMSKFTVVGSPMITNDGVASGFSGQNLIDTVSFSNTNFIIKNRFKTNFANTTNQTLFRCSTDSFSGSFGFLIGFYGATKKIYISGITTSDKTYEIQLEDQTWYDLTVVRSSDDYTMKVYLNNTLIFTEYFTKSNPYLFLTLGGSFNTSVPFQGSIDLKNFSITVDGKEVFSGNKTGIDTIKINDTNIEIPYTLSKTGSKIVDGVYRDRVIDLYEQEGHAGYYTIDETNQNFTLPMGEIYGMIESKVDMLQASGASMPSNKYIDLTLGASGSQYTAPANGYYYIAKLASGEQYMSLSNSTASMGIEMRVPRANEILATYIPVKKGDVCTVMYDASGNTVAFRFIYAEGEI